MDHPSFRKDLLAWYRSHRRSLPWRIDQDPYRVWISEIMLQQTTVEAVIPYYLKFLERYPTLQALAESEEETVLTFWAGLGYYSRARNLRKAAQTAWNSPAKSLPTTALGLRDLPGIGPYTSAAVASIAYNEPVACLDGNVMRVLSRVHAYDGDIVQTKSRDALQRLADDMVDPNAPGDFNQAMMELGATVCTPTKPRCLVCPVEMHCKAREEGRQDELPVKSKKITYVQQEFRAWVITRAGNFLLRQRKPDERMPGMWEFPLATPDETTVRLARHENLSCENASGKPITHTITRHRMSIDPLLIRLKDDHAFDWKKEERVVWISSKKFPDLPLTTITKKILKAHASWFFL